VEPLRVLVRRGGVVESAHRVHAVAVRDGEVVEAAGDPGLVTFMRSAAKPIQALPLARAREDLDDRDLAIASSSHLADDAQLEAVLALLAKAPATEDELECGPERGSRLNHNCSGKHAGMLALCRARGWPSAGYSRPEHPVQRGCLEEVAAAADVPAARIPTACDGCGVVTFALPLERMAHAFSRLERLEGGRRVAAAMRAHPDLIRGPTSPDTLLMRTLDGWTAKGGADGVLCAAGPDGLALALKVEDGAQRALGPALGGFLSRLGLDGAAFGPVSLVNSRGEECGETVIDS
jgi:L-asparaginase II